jgi:ABC-2 type transport system permease protein
MSTTVADSTLNRLRWLIADSLVIARRNLEHVRQIPEKLLDVTLQPVMFVILFAFVFGGVIAIPDGTYREYLLGGVLVQSLGFGIMGPATTIATDLKEGVVDRFRSLPMSRSAYLIGHVLAELCASSIAVAVLSLSGLIVGWRIHSDLPHALAGYGLIMLFAFAMLWCGTLLGIAVRSADAAQGMVFMVVFPMTFLASTFVPIAGFSPFLRVLASWNPISSMAAAVRTLFGNPTGTPVNAAWPLQHPVASAVGWCLILLAICLPLAIRRFRSRTTG